MNNPNPPRNRTVVAHLRAMMNAENPSAFLVELDTFARDPRLSRAQRDAIFRTLAQDEAIRYYHAVSGSLPPGLAALDPSKT